MEELELKPAEPAGIRADEIDQDFPARLSPTVGTAILDDEAVLVDPATGGSHLLDGPGALILQCLDGVSSLREIAVDIADGLSLDRDTVESDVLGLVRTLGRLGLVEGVLRDEHRAHGNAQDLPGGAAVGTDLAGWEGFDGVDLRPMILVNWGTHCGYCSRIAADLADLAPRLEAAGLGLLLVTVGSPEELADQLGDSSLHALHVEQAPEFFQGLGTPVAYAIDAHRLTTTPLAYGADQVLGLALDLADG